MCRKHIHMTAHINHEHRGDTQQGGANLITTFTSPFLPQTAEKMKKVIHLIPIQHSGSQRKLLVWK